MNSFGAVVDRGPYLAHPSGPRCANRRLEGSCNASKPLTFISSSANPSELLLKTQILMVSFARTKVRRY